MMTKREEAAQALYEQQVANKVVKSQFWDLPDSVQDKYYAAVDAVIACIREPDEKMVEAYGQRSRSTIPGTGSHLKDETIHACHALFDAMD